MTTLQFGLALPFGGGAQLVANLAQAADETGWDGVFLGDAIWTQDPLIALAAAAMVTRRIKLGTMVIPAPLRRPWRLASEAVALDHLSNGRLILGLATGATWMGWQGFPDEVTDKKSRAEMLDETIDILTLMFQAKQFDYDGKHYHLRLTLVEEQHYPPQPVQQPRIPLWVAGIWQRAKSMRRVLKCDGVFLEKYNLEGPNEEVTPEDIRGVKTYVEANRTLITPFDIVKEGKTAAMEHTQLQDTLLPWIEAGVTWWIEGLWDLTEEQALERIRRGPPRLD